MSDRREDPRVAPVFVRRTEGDGWAEAPDLVVVEEPLEIQIGWDDGGRRRYRSLAVTLRTPGRDEELAAGFLFTEGIVRCRSDVVGIGPSGLNRLRVELHPDVELDWERLGRHFAASAACGICGKTSIDAVRQESPWNGAHALDGPRVSPAVLHQLPAALRPGQDAFERTGGLHAAALFDAGGAVLTVREDVGRHNAVDKLVGRALLDGRLPLHGAGLLLSGRAGFELVQKAWMAGIGFVAAVGAPSSLAVDLARESGMTLVGFLRDARFNVYAGEERIGGAP